MTTINPSSDDPTESPRLVRDLMTVGVPTCPLHTQIVDLTRLMLEKDLEAVIVLDGRGHAAGVVTRDEVVGAYGADRHHVSDTTAEVVMRPDIPQVPPDIPLRAAAQIMQDLGVRVLFMMHHAGGIEYPAAQLTYQHLLRYMVMNGPNDLRDLGIAAVRKSPVDLFIERRDAARKEAGLDR